MNITVREYVPGDLAQMIDIWNQVIDEGIAFPQYDRLDEESGKEHFAAQTFSAVAEDTDSGEIVGLYILHPNNVGRCGHIGNTTYAVKNGLRGQKIGEKLVEHSLKEGKKAGFRIIQLNAVVRTNTAARKLYVKMGFIPLGTIFGGFKMDGGRYEDIVPYYCDLTKIED